MLDKYRLVGPVYSSLSRLYSGNAIARCKCAMLRNDTIAPGNRVLFAGAGSGDDALHAALLGARVTLVELSPTMIAQFKKNLASHKERDILAVESLQSDVLKLENAGFYDMVVANFFFNVFERDKMETLFAHLVSLIKPGGHLVIGDFAPATGSMLAKGVQNLYWYTAASTLFALTGNAIHQLYDYRYLFEKHQLTLKETQDFDVLSRPLFRSMLISK